MTGVPSPAVAVSDDMPVVRDWLLQAGADVRGVGAGHESLIAWVRLLGGLLLAVSVLFCF